MNRLLAAIALIPAAIAAPPRTPPIAQPPGLPPADPAGFDTSAKVAYLEDVNTGAVLFAKDPDRRMPPASMTKMMTVYVAFSLIKSGKLKLNQTFTMSPDTWRKWHGQGSTMFLSVNEAVSVENLLLGIVTLSGNDACVVLAEGISGTEQAFTDRMNDAAKKLGLTNSRFGTANGWPDQGVTYMSARDLATLAKATIRDFPDLYGKFYSRPDFTWGKTLGNDNPITQQNRDPLLGAVEGADGLKTGHTDESGYSFTGSAIRGGRRLVMVVAGFDSFGQRKDESIRFMEWGFRTWADQPVVAKGREVGSAEVQLGDAGTVPLIAGDTLKVTVPAGTNAPATGRIVYSGPLKAPIQTGQHVADLVVSVPGLAPQTLPLVAGKAIGEAGFFGRFWTGLMQLFGG